MASTCAKKSWNDLTPETRKRVKLLIVLQILLIAIAHGDIARRPEEEIRGSKRTWRLISLIDIAGPVTYFVLGRKKPQTGGTSTKKSGKKRAKKRSA